VRSLQAGCKTTNSYNLMSRANERRCSRGATARTFNPVMATAAVTIAEVEQLVNVLREIAEDTSIDVVTRATAAPHHSRRCHSLLRRCG
jgi:hypothetical protein